jgi:hypothetical protein
MKDYTLLSDIIMNKIERQKHLNSLHSSLDELNDELSLNQLFRWFGTAYFWIKRYTTLSIGVFLLLFGLYMTFEPSSFLRTFHVNEQITIALDLNNIQVDQDPAHSDMVLDINSDNFQALLQKSVQEHVLKQTTSLARILGIVTFILGIGMLYISRLTKKMKKLSVKISRAQEHSALIIENFKQTIKEEEDELVKLQLMVKR